MSVLRPSRPEGAATGYGQPSIGKLDEASIQRATYFSYCQRRTPCRRHLKTVLSNALSEIHGLLGCPQSWSVAETAGLDEKLTHLLGAWMANRPLDCNLIRCASD